MQQYKTIDAKNGNIFKFNELISYIGLRKPSIIINLSGQNVIVKCNSKRLECFRRNHTCVSCGLKGKIWMVDKHIQKPSKNKANCFIEKCHVCTLNYSTLIVGQITYHLNLYSFGRRGKKILFTKDHIFPVSCGGSNNIDNFQTMCFPCNNRKGNTIS